MGTQKRSSVKRGKQVSPIVVFLIIAAVVVIAAFFTYRATNPPKIEVPLGSANPGLATPGELSQMDRIRKEAIKNNPSLATPSQGIPNPDAKEGEYGTKKGE